MDRRKKVIELILLIVLFFFAVGYCIYTAKSEASETKNSVITAETESTENPISTEGITWDIQN